MYQVQKERGGHPLVGISTSHFLSCIVSVILLCWRLRAHGHVWCKLGPARLHWGHSLEGKCQPGRSGCCYRSLAPGGSSALPSLAPKPALSVLTLSVGTRQQADLSMTLLHQKGRGLFRAEGQHSHIPGNKLRKHKSTLSPQKKHWRDTEQSVHVGLVLLPPPPLTKLVTSVYPHFFCRTVQNAAD